MTYDENGVKNSLFFYYVFAIIGGFIVHLIFILNALLEVTNFELIQSAKDLFMKHDNHSVYSEDSI